MWSRIFPPSRYIQGYIGYGIPGSVGFLGYTIWELRNGRRNLKRMEEIVEEVNDRINRMTEKRNQMLLRQYYSEAHEGTRKEG